MNGNSQVLLLAILGLAGVGAYMYVDGNRTEAARLEAARLVAATSAAGSAGHMIAPTGNPATDIMNGIQSGLNILTSGSQLFHNLFN